jgi:hypothetical protein
MKTLVLTADRFWDPPTANRRLTLESIVDRLTAHVERQIVSLLGANALLRLQIEDKARLHREWDTHEGRWVPDSGEEPTPEQEPDDLCLVSDAARRIGAKPDSLQSAVRIGRVPSHGGWPRRVRFSDVERWHRDGEQYRAGQRLRFGHELRTT